MWVKRVLDDSRFVFFVSVLAGLLFPNAASQVEPFLLWVGVVLITTTLLDIDFGGFTAEKWRPMLSLLGLNYVVLSALYLIASFFFSPPYSYGLVFLALMPPSIGVISLTTILRGDMEVSFYAECVAYAISIALIPLTVLLFFGETVPITPVLRVIGFLFVLPLVLSRILRSVIDQRFSEFHSWVKPVFNVCYGLSIFIVLGVNQASLLSNYWVVCMLAAVIVVIRFGLSTFVHHILRHRLRRGIDVDAVLFASFKNGGMAAIFVLTVVGVGASLPLAVGAFIAPFHIMYLEYSLLPVLR